MKTEYLSRIKSRIEAEFKKPGLSEQLERIQKERVSRWISKSRPRLVDWEGLPSDPTEFGLKPPAGSLLLLWATRESGIIAKLERAYSDHNIEALDALHGRLFGDALSRKVIPVRKAVDQLCSAPIFFDLRYAGATLAQNLWLPRVACGSMVFAYNGGQLNDQDFAVAEYRRNSEAVGYDVLIVKSAPILSDVERRAVEAVPDTTLEMNVAPIVAFAATTAVVTVVLIVTANTFAANCGSKFHERLTQVSLPARAIEKLRGPASARELLKLRIQVLQKFGL